MGRRVTLLTALALALALAPGPASAASFPPHLRFRSLETARVVVHYHDGLEAMARQAATLALEILERHERRYGVRLPRLHVVLSDVDDDPNGFATPLPYPIVGLRAAAPTGAESFGATDGWLRVVVTHELAHSAHLELAREAFAAGRDILGRAPFLFPNALSPTWLIEGLATYEETEGTAYGRGRSPDTDMVLRMAALEGAFPDIDEASAGRDKYPGGVTPYLFGESFLQHLSERHGREVLPALAQVHAGRIVPFLDDLTSRRVTGATFTSRWRDWRNEVIAATAVEVAHMEGAGLTPSTPLTARGVQQAAPRFSPDGTWIAYTNRSLDRHRAIHLVRPDGAGDRRLARRNDGVTVSWTPDAREIVFDESEVHELFAVRSDLRAVEVATGRVRKVTRGLRAREPDVSPDGQRVVFVRQMGDRTELATVALDGSDLAAVTASVPGTQWSNPRWSPGGDAIAAARMLPSGQVDLAVVDPDDGTLRFLTDDRARDLEPAWTPDGAHVVFRSDRDGVSNLHAIPAAGGPIVRLTNVLGGAFTPDVSPDGARVAFSDYRSRGHDVHVMALDLASAPPARAFVDPYPPAGPEPAEMAGPDRTYRPWPTMHPRFWSPYFEAGDEFELGVATAGSDPLFRHAYGAALDFGFETRRPDFHAFYQYDRWRPTLLATYDESSDPTDGGAAARSREVNLRATLPLRRTLRSLHAASLTWRRSRDTLEGGEARPLDLGGVELAWSYSSARQFPYSVSPVQGVRARAAYLQEADALGSDTGVGKAVADLRGYHRVFGDRDALALRLGGGTTFGEPDFRGSYAVGGFPEGSLLDVVQTNHSVLRGYAQDAFRGRNFAHANAEYRFPLAHPQRGYKTVPVFLRHLHAAVFADAAAAWSGTLDGDDVKVGVGAAVGADLNVFYGLGITFTAGLAHGFSDVESVRTYFRSGLSF
jgi:Tol biopolymer transport system component